MNLKTIQLYTGILVILSITMTIPAILPPFVANSNDNKITVMSFNLHQYYVQDPSDIFQKTGLQTFEKVRDLIHSINPDIVGLQESEGNRLTSGNQNGVQWLAQQLGMYYYYGPPTSAQIYGVAILSRWPIIEQEWKQLPRPEGIERAVVRVVIDSPFGDLLVFNTHFEIERFKEAQKQQAQFVINYVGSQKAIVIGDFNANYTEGAFQILNDTFTYGLVEAGFRYNDPIAATFPANEPIDKIDYIWLTKGDWNVVPNSYRTVGDPLTSDHRAVIIDIQMN